MSEDVIPWQEIEAKYFGGDEGYYHIWRISDKLDGLVAYQKMWLWDQKVLIKMFLDQGEVLRYLKRIAADHKITRKTWILSGMTCNNPNWIQVWIMVFNTMKEISKRGSDMMTKGIILEDKLAVTKERRCMVEMNMKDHIKGEANHMSKIILNKIEMSMKDCGKGSHVSEIILKKLEVSMKLVIKERDIKMIGMRGTEGKAKDMVPVKREREMKIIVKGRQTGLVDLVLNYLTLTIDIIQKSLVMFMGRNSNLCGGLLSNWGHNLLIYGELCLLPMKFGDVRYYSLNLLFIFNNTPCYHYPCKTFFGFDYGRITHVLSPSVCG